MSGQPPAALRPLTLRTIEERSPVESLTVYRALVVFHVAGALFALLGLALNPGAIASPWRTPTLVFAVLQLAGSWWLLLHPEWVPRLVLSRPQITLAVSIVVAAFYLLPAVDPLAPPTVTVAFAWISTAAAVLPPRGWPVVGVAASAGIAGLWTATGLVGSVDPVVRGAIALGAAGVLPGAINAAWMGATGALVARRVRRWGLVIGHENGALADLDANAAAVRSAAADLLRAEGDRLDPASTIAVGTLRHAVASSGSMEVELRDYLREVVGDLRPPFEILVEGDSGALVEQAAARTVGDATLRHLTNVLVHAPSARTVEINVTPSGDRVLVTIDDDGGGAPPAVSTEGEGSGISRAALGNLGAVLKYEQGRNGVRLVLALPSGRADLTLPGLADGLRDFISKCLRNNRWATYLSPVPYLAFGSDGLAWTIPLLVVGGIAIEVAFSRAGPAGGNERVGYLLLGVGIGTAMTLTFAVTLSGSDPFVPSAATAYPVVELAWRGRWRWWMAAELARGAGVAIWLFSAGPGGVGGAYVLPLALTLIAVGGRQLVKRAEEVEHRVGGAVARRQRASRVVQQAGLRHDVVNHIGGRRLSPGSQALLDELDRAVARLAASPLPAASPVEDLLAGLQAAAAPAPLVVEDRRTEPPTRRKLSGALEVERRLASLELGAAAGTLFVNAVPPRWTARTRLRALNVRIDDNPSGGQMVLVVADTEADAVALEPDAVAELASTGLRAELARDGMLITIPGADDVVGPSSTAATIST
ncbi:MAG: hypothetical protein J7513_00290 [Solirubrobacteraceae bacterium]|nr:hypothetical protein [Solirubrobacteraceae bacterium]